MKTLKIILLCALVLSLTNCASGYKLIKPKTINYISTDTSKGVHLEYKFDLLDKKYKKKELSNGIKLIAVKILNNSDKDLKFGDNLKLTHQDGTEIHVLENESVFRELKQSPASYLWYLLLTPLNFQVIERNSNGFQEVKSTTPIGLAIGPGLAGGNMIAANSANEKLKKELLNYNINGSIIKKGETRYGLIGIKSNSFFTLKLKVE